jgi:molybdopterin/thiamine biosynthesis adenylyltransferase
VVIGSGGIGTWLIEGLVRQMAFSEYKNNCALLIVDGDYYEPKNRARQSFKELGNKAEVKAAEVAPAFPEVFVSAIPSFVVDEYPSGYDPKAEELIKVNDLLVDGDIVFCVVDNFAARKTVFEAAKKYDNIDIYTGGNDDQFYGSVYHYQRRNGADVTDNPVETHPELANPADRNPGLMSCQEKAELAGSTQLIATNCMVAAVLLTRFQVNILQQLQDTQSEIMFDFSATVSDEVSVTGYDQAVDVVELATV